MPTARPVSLRKPLAFALALLSAIGLAGCGGKDKSAGDSVSGKVTMNGTPVAGQVVFIGPEKKEFVSIIATTNGYYQITNPVKGEYQILIKSMGGAPAHATKGDVKSDLGAGTSNTVPPPAKYAKEGNGLTFTVTGGRQVKDIELQP